MTFGKTLLGLMMAALPCMATAHVFDGMFTHVEVTTNTMTVVFRLSAQDGAVLAERSDLDKDGYLAISEAALQKIPVIAAFSECLILTSDGEKLKPSGGQVKVLNDEGTPGKAHELIVTLTYQAKPGSPFGKLVMDPNLFARVAESRGQIPKLPGRSMKNILTIQDRGKFTLLQCTGKEKYESPGPTA